MEELVHQELFLELKVIHFLENHLDHQLEAAFIQVSPNRVTVEALAPG